MPAKRDYSEYIDLNFGRLKVVDIIWKQQISRNGKKWNEPYFICECSCTPGNTKEHRVHDVIRGAINSCGCKRKDSLSELMTTHGKSKTKLYAVYYCIINRCENPNSDDYYLYGARGVTLHSAWRNDFLSFCDYVSNLDHYGESGYSIDRIDTNGNYEPGNIRWATATEQTRNRRLNKTNTTGIPGVTYHSDYNRWEATIGHNGKHIYLGYFKTKEAAAEARAAGEQKYWSEVM